MAVFIIFLIDKINALFYANYITTTYGIGLRKEKMDSRASTIVNLKKAKGHIEKVIKMVEEGEYCIDIMQQNLAVIGLLKSAHQMLLEGHLNTCFKNAMSSNNEKRKKEMITEILKVTRIANK